MLEPWGLPVSQCTHSGGWRNNHLSQLTLWSKIVRVAREYVKSLYEGADHNRGPADIGSSRYTPCMSFTRNTVQTPVMECLGQKRIAGIGTVYYAEKTEQTANHAVLNILRAIKVKITLTSMLGTTRWTRPTTTQDCYGTLSTLAIIDCLGSVQVGHFVYLSRCISSDSKRRDQYSTLVSWAMAAAAAATGVSPNNRSWRTANPLNFWFVADTKETTGLTADKHINRR